MNSRLYGSGIVEYMAPWLEEYVQKWRWTYGLWIVVYALYESFREESWRPGFADPASDGLSLELYNILTNRWPDSGESGLRLSIRRSRGLYVYWYRPVTSQVVEVTLTSDRRGDCENPLFDKSSGERILSWANTPSNEWFFALKTSLDNSSVEVGENLLVNKSHFCTFLQAFFWKNPALNELFLDKFSVGYILCWTNLLVNKSSSNNDIISTLRLLYIVQ